MTASHGDMLRKSSCCVSLQAQYQAFVRFAVESSTASAIALNWTCVLEPFTRRALVSRTLASPVTSYGASNPGPMLWAERSRSRAIFQVVFWDFIGAFCGPRRPLECPPDRLSGRLRA